MTDIVGNGAFAALGRVNANGQIWSSARLADGGLVYVYQVGQGPIFAQMLDAAGQPAGGPIEVTSASSQAMVTGLAGGGFAVAWAEQDPALGFNSRFVVQRTFDASGEAFGDAAPVSLGTFYMHVDVELTALDDGNFVVTWLQMNPQLNQTFSLKARTVDGAGTPLGSEIVLNDEVRSGSDDALLLPDGNVLIAYVTGSAGTPRSIAFTAYDPAGSAASTDFEDFVLPAEVLSADLSLTQLASGKVLVSWLAQEFNGYTLHGAVYEASGSPTGDAFSLPIDGDVRSDSTYIAALDGGGFVAVYPTADGTLEARIFDDETTPVGASFSVSDPGSPALQPIITAFGTNDFAIGWIDNAQQGGIATIKSYFDVTDGTNDADVLNGTAAPDFLRGLAGADTLNGLAGDDFLVGGEGADTIDGGSGSDTAIYSDSTAGVTIDLAQQTASGGTAEGDTLISIENLVGSDYSDLLIGDTGPNRLEGGAGADTLIGGAGADRLVGGAGADTADYGSSSAGVTVNLTTGTGTGGDAEGDVLAEIENLRGSAFADVLTGNAAANRIEGLGGDDILAGGINADTLDGGDGNDTVTYAASANRVVVNLSSALAQVGGDAQGDTLISIANVIGSAANDVLSGDGGANRLDGGDGDDTLTGGAGADTLVGGAGNDLFQDTAAGLNGDTITDFALGERIRITDANMAAFAFTLTGTTLTYTGGAMTLESLPEGLTLRAAAAAGGGVELVLAPAAPPIVNNGLSGDYDGDGRDDILWRNDNGDFSNWLGQANGGFSPNDANAFTQVPVDWKIIGAGDFNGDGKDDVLWRHQNGALSNWLGQPGGSLVANDANALAQVPTAWKVAGTGDFNGDGRDDILWRNEDGTLSNWLGQANGGFTANDANAAVLVDTAWNVVGVGDFNGDGRDDILWRNEDGTLSNWLGQGGGGFTANDANAAVLVDTAWNVVGVGDFNGDGRDDILWRNEDGTLSNWLGQANGGLAANDANALSQVALDWQIAGTGDFNGDGRGDILWRETNSGALSDWLGQADGGFVSNDANAFVQGVPLSWQIQVSDNFVL